MYWGLNAVHLSGQFFEGHLDLRGKSNSARPIDVLDGVAMPVPHR